VVKVPGEHRVPIRCRRGGPDNGEPKQAAVYIRRPKPESAPIEEPHEWDDLFERCIRARRDETVEHFMAVVRAVGVEGLAEALGSVTGAGASGPRKAVDEFRRTSTDRFGELVSQHGLQHLYEHGLWSVSYAVVPSAGPVPLQRLLEMLTDAAGNETGWPPWWVPTREGITPYTFDDMIECWLAEPEAPPPGPDDWLRTALGPKDGAHADFWRASPAGHLFLARGYQEDGRQGSTPGEQLDFTTVPIWRLAECLLQAQRFALEYGGPDSTVAFSIRWEGLAGRTLISVTEREINPRRSNQDVVESYGEFAAAGMKGRLAEIVQELARPLYAAFEFFDPPLSLYEEELARMLDR
jgi:transcriptional regulator with XRE-family HTH domain